MNEAVSSGKGVWVEGGLLADDTIIEIKKPDKILGSDGTTRRDIVEYYNTNGWAILPYLKDRRLTGVRYPDGISGRSFFLKTAPKNRPEWVQTVPAPHGEEDGLYLTVPDLRTLIWLASTDVLELHVPNTLYDKPDQADSLIIDLDPGEGCSLRDCAEIAMVIEKTYLNQILEGSRVFYKTSGSKGLHMGISLPHFIPLDNAIDTTKTIAETAFKDLSSKITTKRGAAERVGKVFIDWQQNTRHRTTVVPYSLRGRNPIGVSMPITGAELDSIATGTDLSFGLKDTELRLLATGDTYINGLRRI